MALIEFTISFFAYAISKQGPSVKAEPVYRLAIFFYAIASLVEVVIWIYLLWTRFTHAGRVCSGDYLNVRNAPVGYCPTQGRAILIVALLALLGCFCTVCIVPFVAGRRRRTNRTVAIDLDR